MKTDIWMPLYINDFLADTMTLSAEEVGGYMLIIMSYWKKGSIGGDIDRISRSSRIAPSITQALLEEFFIFENDVWIHPRIEKELEIARENKRKREERSRRAARARWGENDAPSNAPSIPTSNAPGNAGVEAKNMLEECPSPSPSPINKKNKENFKRKQKSENSIPSIEEIEEYRLELESGVEADVFFDYYQARGWKWKSTLIEDWQAVFRNWDRRLRKAKGQDSRSATAPAADHLGTDEEVPEEEIQRLLSAVGA